MMSSLDFYAVLDVDPRATQDEIRAAYYRQVRRHPPEKDEEGFQRVQQAYDVLSDSQTRAEYDEQRRTDPETQNLVNEGRELLEEDDPDAVVPLKRALMRQPESLYIRDLFVQALMVGEEYEDAERQARVLIAAVPENPVYYLRLGDILRADDRDDEAEAPFRKALEFDQETPQPVIKLAYLLYYLDRADEAVRLLRRAILRDGRVDFEDFLFFQTLCRITVFENQIERLRELRLEIRKILPPDPETRSFVAWFYYQDALMLASKGNFDAALPMIEEAAQIDSSLPELDGYQQRIRDSKTAMDELPRLHDDDGILAELRFAVGPLVIMRLIGLEGDFKETFERAVEALGQHATTEGSPLGEHLRLLRVRYPGVAAVVGDFLKSVEETVRSAPKTRMTIRCPNCGHEGWAEQPSLKSLVRSGFSAHQASTILNTQGRENAKRYLIYTCKVCSTVFNGQSQSVKAGAPSPTEAPKSIWQTEISQSWGCLVPLIIGFIILMIVNSGDSPSASNRKPPRSSSSTTSRTVDRSAQRPALPAPVRSTTMHVRGEALNVRSGPGTGYQRIAGLTRFDDVELLSKDDSGWGRIRLNDGREGYVAVTYLGSGPGKAAKLEWCKENAGPRPGNGELLNLARTGPHTFTIHNSVTGDALVKLKDRNDRTVVALYVRSGETATTKRVPEGAYQVVYASGSSFSRACGYFLDDLSVTRANTTATFYSSKDAVYTYTAINEMTLYRVAGGNLTTKTASLGEFLD